MTERQHHPATLLGWMLVDFGGEVDLYSQVVALLFELRVDIIKASHMFLR